MENVVSNERFDYLGFGVHESFCYLDIYIHNGKYLVILTEPQESDSGTSVTNACETIATDLLNSEYLNEVNPENVIWIEHYEKRSSYPETFDVIEFYVDDENRILSNPEWTHFGSSLDDEDIINLLER